MGLSSPAVTTDDPTEDAVSDALHRLLASRSFRDVPRLSRFLSFVVSESLAGRGDRLKGVVIAVEVFDKDDPEDAQTTTIVRVEAGRLRRRLDDYYAGEGANEKLRISVPKGGYNPHFEHGIPEEAKIGPSTVHKLGSEPTTGRTRNGILLLLTLTLLLSVVTVGAYYATRSPEAVFPPLGISDLTVLAVLPLEPYELEFTRTGIGAQITETIIAHLSRRSDLSVMALSSLVYYRSEIKTVKDIGAELNVSHVLKGGYSTAQGKLNVNLVLHDARNGFAVWSDSYSGDYGGDSPGQIQDTVNRAIAGITEELGLRSPHSSAGPGAHDANAYDLFRQARNMTHPPSNSMRVRLALGIFNEMIDKYPQFAEAYAGAAYAHAALLWWNNSEDPVADDESILRFANQALTLDVNSSLAHIALGMREKHYDNHHEAVVHLENAVEAQPSNSFALSVLAMYKIYDGQREGTVELVQKAIRLDPINPRVPYWNILGMVQYHNGNYAAARDAILANIRRDGPQHNTIRYYLAAAMARTGRPEVAAEIVADLQRTDADLVWQLWIHKNFEDKAELGRLLEPLEPYGVERSSKLVYHNFRLPGPGS